MSALDKEQFDQVAKAIRDEQFEEALVLLDALIDRHPRAAALHWHRSRCLENLWRESEAIDALDQVIALKPDYVPALIARVRHANNEGEIERFEPLLHQVLTLEPAHPQALTLLAMIRQGNDADPTEILDLVNRSLASDPEQVDALMMRGEFFVSQSMEPSSDPDPIRDVMGIVYQRHLLEQALADFRRASMLGSDLLPVMRFADTAGKLGLDDEALAQCDIALGRLSADDTHGRRAVEQLRARIEGGDQATRDQLAAMFESSYAGKPAERSIDDDIAYAALQGTADLLRKGKDVDVALDAFISDSPDDLVATNIARQIFNFAHEAVPGLQEVDAKDYPAFQTNHARTCERQLASHGYAVMADVEAMNLSAQMGMRALIRLFVNPGVGSAAAFALKPKWPGLIGFVVMLLSGQWRAQRMLECKTRLRSGIFLVTRAMGPDPWDHSSMDRVQFEKLPQGTSPAKVAARHEQRVRNALAEDPNEGIDLAHTLDEIEGQWIETNQIKMEHRIALGYVTEQELRAVLGKQYDRFADKVRSRLELMGSD